MNIREYLKEILRLQRDIECLEDECKRWESIAHSISTGRITDTPFTSKADYSATFERASEKIIELREELDNKSSLLNSMRGYLSKKIDKLDDTEYQIILRCRYIQGLTLNEIAYRIYTSKTTTWRKEQEAIKKLENY